MFLEAFWNCFTLLKGQKLETARRMPQKSFFFAEMGCIYTGPNYIKRQSDSDNFLTFWYTLLCTFEQKFARTPEQSARIAIYAIFLAHSAYFNISRQKVP